MKDTSKRIFHGKLLLFGEHSVIDGSKALVLPYLPVSARLAFVSDGPGYPDGGISNRSLGIFADFLAGNQGKNPAMPTVDMARLKTDISQGLYFLSTIPGKYGLGSSGALCAAIYDEYGMLKSNNPDSFDLPDLQLLRRELAAMESHFHGRSSGVDPLCIYYDKPIIVEGPHKVIPTSMDKLVNPGLQVFLLDTGMISSTADLVKGFRKKLNEKGIEESYTRQYLPIVNQAVDQFTNGILTFESVLRLSVFQLVIFGDMIPSNFISVWQYGLESEYYACKLCGSGGGGYLLGFTEDFEKASRSLIGRYNIKPVLLNLG